MNKMYKVIITAAVLLSGFTACSSRLDVNDPNYFTDEDIKKFISESDANAQLFISGLVSNLPNYINQNNADFNGGYSNTYAYESSFELRRFMQSGDIVEGSSSNQGTYSNWYTNNSSITYWKSDQNVENYGYYLPPTYKIAAAQKVLDYLPDSIANTSPLKRGYQAEGLTIKAIGYMQLMERYTDLQNVTSKTDQGWPIYNSYSYNTAQEPLSVADTWAWIKNTFAKAADQFHNSNIGTQGYTIGNESAKIYDIDCAVCQYYRARAALDMKDWATVIDAATDLLSHYPNLISASNYGMDQNKMESVAKRNSKGWCGNEFNAKDNAFYNLEINPEAIFGGARGGSNIFWSLDGFNTLKVSPANYRQVDENIYNALSDNDCRKACILSKDFNNFPIYTYENKDSTWYSYTVPAYTSLKWAATSGIDHNNQMHDNQYTTSDNIYLRSSAVLLMLAEAYAQNSQPDLCKATLNTLLAARTKVGAQTMTCDNTMPGKSPLDMVKLQWRIEMWGEGDWAFFNQKRWNEKPSRGANHWSSTTISNYTWEIPEKERQGNPYWK